MSNVSVKEWLENSDFNTNSKVLENSPALFEKSYEVDSQNSDKIDRHLEVAASLSAMTSAITGIVALNNKKSIPDQFREGAAEAFKEGISSITGFCVPDDTPWSEMISLCKILPEG